MRDDLRKKVNAFKKALSDLPKSKRFYKRDQDLFDSHFCKYACVFGLPVHENPFDTIKSFPEEVIRGLYFYLGADITALLSGLLIPEVTETLEHLTIGLTKGNYVNYSDYADISSILAETHFPVLRHFEYGVDELLANEHCLYGNLGDITPVLRQMPQLEKIELFGNFMLTEPINLSHLLNVEILMNDWATNINGGKITNDTLHNFLSSDLGRLKSLSLDVDFNDDIYEYSLPAGFLGSSTIQQLDYLHLSGNFVNGTKEQLQRVLFKATAVLCFDDLNEKE